MTSKLPLLVAVGAFLLAIVYTVVAGTIGPVQNYGTATRGIDPAVTVLNATRDDLATALQKTYKVTALDSHAYAYNEENYRYGTATCPATDQGKYFTSTTLGGGQKLPKSATYTAAKALVSSTAKYTLNVTTAGSGNVAQIVIRDSANRKPVATMLAIIPGGSNTVVISGSTANCLSLDTLPKTTAKDLVNQ